MAVTISEENSANWFSRANENDDSLLLSMGYEIARNAIVATDSDAPTDLRVEGAVMTAIEVLPTGRAKNAARAGSEIIDAIDDKLGDAAQTARRNEGAVDAPKDTPDVRNTETETYFRVEGGDSGNATSQNRITTNADGSISIRPGCNGQLCVSVENADHATYFLTNNRPDGTVVVFEVDAKLHKEIMDSAIPQRPVPGIPRDPNAPQVVDPNKPGTALQLPKIWESLLENNSSNARVLTHDEFLKEFKK